MGTPISGCDGSFAPLRGEPGAAHNINENCCSQSAIGLQNVECVGPQQFGFEGTIRRSVILDFRSGTIHHAAATRPSQGQVMGVSETKGPTSSFAGSSEAEVDTKMCQVQN